MPSKTLPFGELRPDLPPAGQVVVAQNVYPTASGYTPAKAFGAITPALAGITGGAAFVSSKGETSFIAGDHNSLQRYSGAAWAPLIVALTADRWRFAQFGDNVIAVHGGEPISYSLLTGAAAYLAGNPPAADLVATVRDFVVLAGDPNALLTVTWSGFNDSTQWMPTENQSDSQKLAAGGEVMGLAGGEYGIVLQKYAIKRMTYVGPETYFQFDEISSNVGCMAKGSVAQAGRMVFFLSERGFMMCDGNEALPIGVDKVDATFFAAYSRQDIVSGIYAAVDPRCNIVVWSMPGTPGTLWCYHWTLQRWTTIVTNARLVFSGFTANVPLEAIDALYGNLDAVPLSLDDAAFAGGNPLFLVATAAGVVGTMSGDNLEGVIGVARTELAPMRTRIRMARPVTDATDVTVQIQGRARSGDKALVESSSDMRPSGDVPLRVNAREIVPTITMRGAWTFAQGVTFDFEPGGAR